MYDAIFDASKLMSNYLKSMFLDLLTGIVIITLGTVRSIRHAKECKATDDRTLNNCYWFCCVVVAIFQLNIINVMNIRDYFQFSKRTKHTEI